MGVRSETDRAHITGKSNESRPLCAEFPDLPLGSRFVHTCLVIVLRGPDRNLLFYEYELGRDVEIAFENINKAKRQGFVSR
ncbi:hypothetical protein KIN20_007804 [Parelaphostrongylus tenuis]|uniref:Uncharacterized protein n=1 Tax=Parelaphostrongylus tenuis TaxID=148309 RepID=A0AAD5MVY9_PARTN|nr:hypothetical protein KIN20_007804 [Parelaphostrongylus tenuis]